MCIHYIYLNIYRPKYKQVNQFVIFTVILAPPAARIFFFLSFFFTVYFRKHMT